MFEDANDALPVACPPKLIVVSIDDEQTLLKDSEDANDSLRRCVLRMVNSLHSCGTIVFTIPRPWSVHAYRIRGVYHRFEF